MGNGLNESGENFIGTRVISTASLRTSSPPRNAREFGNRTSKVDS